MALKIKPVHGERYIAFKSSTPGKVPLKNRNQEDLIRLAIVGLESKDKSILDLFEGPLPSLDDLKKGKTEIALKELEGKKPRMWSGTSPTTSTEDKK
jgi:hypothetical protein